VRDSSSGKSLGDWRNKLGAAQREDDPQKLRPLATAAEDAIFARLQELSGKNTIENEEIARAIATLRELQVTKLGFPRWSGENVRLVSKKDV
jgi:hypothetical protein